MANTRSSAKRARQNLRRQARNQRIKSNTRTSIKVLQSVVPSADKEKISAALKAAIQTLDRSASKGVIPKKRASRKMSRLTRFVQKAIATQAP